MTSSADKPPLPSSTEPKAEGHIWPRSKRPIPPMEVVTKGWWTMKVRRVPLEVLEAEDRAREAAETARQEARRRR